jgi:methyl-accepting chemotaxis protein
MKNMKIKAKLIVSFMLIVVLAAAIGLTGIISVIHLSGEMSLLNERMDMSITSARMGRDMQGQRAAYLGTIMAFEMGLLDTAAEYSNTLTSLDASFLEAQNELSQRLQTTEGKRLLSAIVDSYSQFQTARTSLINIAESPSSTTAQRSAALSPARDAANVLADNLAALTDFINDLTDSQSRSATSTANAVTVVLIVVLAVSAAIAILLSLYIAGSISNPVQMMMGFLKQVGETGNLSFTEEEWRKIRATMTHKDEISQSLGAFVKMLEQMVYYGESLQTVANQDLTLDIKLLGSGDTMGIALRKMVDSLNNIFNEIRSAANQVSSGSQQIANGAQSLAQGATEQAASVAQLSNSISKVAGSIKDAAGSARSAADLTNNIKTKAEQGSTQMGDMMEAVQEINEASQNINKVIKVIDDIAFQTNILALNAAVEAARAGQYGKGFAVVAEEVRNLAAKSGEAAKDTSTLIGNSITKADLGVKIASQTSESLREIVEGIIASTQISNGIAVSADEQSAAITEIDTGIDQVAQVVQQNSATAEESAAASEELSGQASMLNSLIGQFKLKNAAPGQMSGQKAPQWSPMPDYQAGGGFESQFDDKY